MWPLRSRPGIILGFIILAGHCSLELFGSTQRVENTTLKMPDTALTFGYTTERAFGDLRLPSPLAMRTPPGETNRLFVVEQSGVVSVITNLAAPTRTVFLDLTSRVLSGGEQGLLGLAFHPGYSTNHYFYLFYTGRDAGSPDRLSRFQTSPGDPNRGLFNSELVLINQRDEAVNHNAGDLHFGPDGYLYISLGDEGGGNDSFQNSQRLDKDFFSGIIRIDVDKLPSNLEPNPHPSIVTNGMGLANYSVPSDNPFLGLTNFNGAALRAEKVRTEFWAVGLRNPWRMSFDSATGLLYCGDVGQDTREQVDIIVKGANYGWNYREGLIARPGSPKPPLGFMPTDPIFDYGRNLGVSVIGGVVYRGHRFAQIFGAYIFADDGSGNIWALRRDGTNAVSVQLLAVDKDISAFGIDPRNGDVLFCDIGENTIKRLVYSSEEKGAPLPATLDATGAFSDLSALTPQAGIVPYDINVPFWSDHAQKRRWFSVPDTNQTIGFSADNNWSLPTGTVWVKNFELQLTNGFPESARRLETRFIVRTTDGVYGATYRWGSSTTNATLVPEEGLDEPLQINDGGVIRTQVWHYPSRAECLACHTAAGGWALGFNTPQMNREVEVDGRLENQIRSLNEKGYLNPPATQIETLRALASLTNADVSLTYRVRSYLAANCAQCHQLGGTAPGFWDARIKLSLSSAGIIDGRLNDSGGETNNRVISPGSLEHSMLLRRVSTLGPGRMPPLATRVLDQQAIDLLTQWITEGLKTYESLADWQLRFFNSTNGPDA
jgi:glucose/arabinose dehydrogenase